MTGWHQQPAVLHELVRAQAGRTPDGGAANFENDWLTYRELVERATRWSSYLRALGVRVGQPVGMCLERSLQLPVIVLAILEAGGVVIPLEPSDPADRTAEIIRDLALRLIVTQRSLHERCASPGVPVVLADQPVPRHASIGAAPVTADDLAFVHFTSGSTGIPKAVMVSHAAVAARMYRSAADIPEAGRCMAIVKTAIGHSPFLGEMLAPLLHGCYMAIARPGGHRDLTYLAELIAEHRVTHLATTSSVLSAFLRGAGADRCDALRRVYCGGEEVPEDLRRRCAEQLPDAQFVVTYGTTESGHALSWECSPSELRARSTEVLIGRPIANTEAYVLDHAWQPVPIGVRGELYIAGNRLARGYLNRADLTAEKFLPDPFSKTPGARMYRTGDQVRWRADGQLELLGRLDHQVKLRGFRIELGAIEARLVQHDAIKEAVVVAREDVPGEKRLVAYMVSQPEAKASVEELRAHLKVALPEYMVPNAFVFLERFPLTSNGKLDRRVLPMPELSAYVSGPYEAPCGDVEEALAGIWQSLLRVERVGRRDNFFDLGGHSLLIVQLLERLRQAGLSVEVGHVFDNPMLGDLAQVLTRGVVEQVAVSPSLIPPDCARIEPPMLPLADLEPEHIERIVRSVPGGAANVQDIYPLVPLQEGILFHHLLDARHGDPYVCLALLLVNSRERMDELIAALQAVLDRHDALRTAVLWEGLPRPMQVVYRQATLPVKEVQLHPDGDPMSQVTGWLEPERQRLDLRKAPLVQLQVAADPHSRQYYVLMQIHHIVTDHVAWKTVVAETIAHLQGSAHELPASLPYRNHVAQSLAYARTHDADAFFRRKLADVVEPTAPFGLLDVHASGNELEVAREKFEPDLAWRIRVQARSVGVIPATLFHAGWGLVVAHTSGRDDVVFGSLLLGRLQGSAGAQRILGMFINTLPLRLRLREVTARALVEQTQRELVELLSHEQASLTAAQRCSGIIGSAPLFTSLLNYRHSVMDIEADWSRASGIEVVSSRERTNYPITLSVDDLGEDFTLTALTDKRIDPHRVMGYLRTAMESLVEALETAPESLALTLSILPLEERRQLLELFNTTQTT